MKLSVPLHTLAIYYENPYWKEFFLKFIIRNVKCYLIAYYEQCILKKTLISIYIYQLLNYVFSKIFRTIYSTFKVVSDVKKMLLRDQITCSTTRERIVFWLTMLQLVFSVTPLVHKVAFSTTILRRTSKDHLKCFSESLF